MPAGPLETLLGYQVRPRQTSGFAGGSVRITSQLSAALDAAFDKERLEDGSSVNFNLDPTDLTRTHDVRSRLLTVAFGQPQPQKAAGEELAARLGQSTDGRSKDSLLLISIHTLAVAGQRRVILWTFPQQEVFRLKSRRSASLDLEDAFVRESNLRKAALFEGGNRRVDFLDGRVLDLQSSSADRSVANLWIGKFLDARLQMSDEEGTRALAQALRHAHDRATSVEERSQIHAAIVSIRHSRRSRLSIHEVATSLGGPAGELVEAGVRNQEFLNSQFGLARELFDELVQFRVFELEGGIVVTAPFSTMEESDRVRITGEGDNRRLTASGLIESERVRARRG